MMSFLTSIQFKVMASEFCLCQKKITWQLDDTTFSLVLETMFRIIVEFDFQNKNETHIFVSPCDMPFVLTW